MSVSVQVQLSSGSTYVLGPGDVIGRMAAAALHLDDPRISEAHAMVSLRGDALQLLALRGRFSVEGVPRAEVTLRPGLRVALARGLELEVQTIVLPEQVLALEGDDLPRQVLQGVHSLFSAPHARLESGFHGDADAWFWSVQGVWRLQSPSGSTRLLLPGDQLQLGGKCFTLVAVPVQALAVGVTCTDGAIAAPLRIHTHFDTVHIHQESRVPLAIDGLHARLLSELVAFGGPVDWQVLAGELWQEAADLPRIRRRLDVTVSRLRMRLRDAGVRPDLVRATGAGQFELFLHERDSVIDAS